MRKQDWIEYYVSRICACVDVSHRSAEEMAKASYEQDPEEDPTEAADIEIDYLMMDVE